MGKSYIERLINGAVEKNINARPSIGKYTIDLEYIKDGCIYYISKNNKKAFTISRDIVNEKISIQTFDGYKGIDLINLHEYFKNKNKFNTYDISIK